MGYTLPVRTRLAGEANVHRPAENCLDRANGLRKLDATPVPANSNGRREGSEVAYNAAPAGDPGAGRRAPAPSRPGHVEPPRVWAVAAPGRGLVRRLNPRGE